MEEKKKDIPHFGCISFLGEAPAGLPKVRIVKCGTKNKDYAPIEVKRTIQPGVRKCEPGDSIDWREAYS